MDAWRAEEVRARSGWDFSTLDGRLSHEQPPWDFTAICRAAGRVATSVLDLGTGGGEQLLRLRDRLPADVIATEGWPPNIPVASRALAPYHIPVVDYDAERGDTLPFPDGRFDLIIDRHEAYDAAEVARVLVPGGVFLTQQVGGDNFAELRDVFGAPHLYPGIQLPELTAEAEAAGLHVTESAAWRGSAEFLDVAALVAYCMLVPWDVPDDFGVDRYRDTLLTLHGRAQPLRFSETSFWLRAVKSPLR